MHEEIKTHPDDVFNTLLIGFATDVVAEDVVEDCRGQGFDLRKRKILSCVAAKLDQYLEIRVDKVVLTGVTGPHAGEDLSCRAEILLHLLLFHFFVFDGKFSGAHVIRKNGERDRILDMCEVGVQFPVQNLSQWFQYECVYFA